MQRKKRSYTPGHFDLRVQQSKTGRGMFTYSPIPRGACIIEYAGRPATAKQVRENTGKYLFWTSDTTMIDGNVPANKARFINHSCVPNCEIDIRKRRIYVFALRAIKPGEELTYDYGEEYFNMHFRMNGCLCGKCPKGKNA